MMQAHNLAAHPTDAFGVGIPVAVTGITMLGVRLQDWVYIFAILVSIMQIVRGVVALVGWWQRRKVKQV